MLVIDGRNPHEVPKTIELRDYEILETWIDDNVTILCLKVNEKFIPCVVNHKEDNVLCAEYKTYRGFENWVKRFHERARKES